MFDSQGGGAYNTPAKEGTTTQTGLNTPNSMEVKMGYNKEDLIADVKALAWAFLAWTIYSILMA